MLLVSPHAGHGSIKRSLNGQRIRPIPSDGRQAKKVRANAARSLGPTFSSAPMIPDGPFVAILQRIYFSWVATISRL